MDEQTKLLSDPVEQPINKNVVDEFEKIQKAPHKSKRWIGCLVFIVIILLSAFRVPLLGVYTDSYIFDLIFGTYKYALYAFLLVYLFVLMISKTLFYKLMNKRVFCPLILFSIFGSLVISIVWHVMHTTQVDNFVGAMQTYISNWESYSLLSDQSINNPKIIYEEFFNFYFTGGIVIELIYGFAQQFVWVFFIVISIPFLLFGINIIANKKIFTLERILRRLFPHLFIQGKDNTFAFSKQNANAEVFNVDFELIKKDVLESKRKLPSVDYLIDTTNNYYRLNYSLGIELKNKLLDFFRAKNFLVEFDNIVVMPLYTDICFISSKKEELKKIFNHRNKIGHYIGTKKYLIKIKENQIIFEFVNQEFSKISIKSLLKTCNTGRGSNIPYGINLENKPICLEMAKIKSAIIVGQPGSGMNMLLNVIIFTLAYLNSPKDMNFVIFSTNRKTSVAYFSILPHLVSTVATDSEQIKEQMSILINTLEKNRTKTILFFDMFESFVNDSSENKELLIALINKIEETGGTVFLLAKEISNSSTNEILNLMQCKFVLKLDSPEMSKYLIGSEQACDLKGNGDGFFIYENESKVRFQACYLSIKELQYNLDVIETFYKTIGIETKSKDSLINTNLFMEDDENDELSTNKKTAKIDTKKIENNTTPIKVEDKEENSDGAENAEDKTDTDKSE